ncbi:MAG: hypothetical protein C4550_04090 [Nitrospiraceae bacterium]|nr:MAG: hypothetical protein C4550_04090 [Nitrospiraceae bacterium]
MTKQNVDSVVSKSCTNPTVKTTAENMHKLFLEALRHREQEIFQYLALLAPALGGFIWLIHKKVDDDLFVVGTLSVIFLLFVGVIYSLSLGYNYRYLTLQLAKLEARLEVTDFMLTGWPRTPEEFLSRYKFMSIPWCTPPEIIKIFWIAFMVGIVGVTDAVSLLKPDVKGFYFVVITGIVSIIIGLISPIYYGVKLSKKIDLEGDKF